MSLTHAPSVALSAIDAAQDMLNALSQAIWKHPELSYEEIYAHDYICTTLERMGFQVRRSYHLDTAFRAEFTAEEGKGPVVCVICEYDAVLVSGHSCGHNLISEAGVAAALGIKACLQADPSLSGKIVVIGTPAQERGGGKIQLIRLGAFRDIDVALMARPCRSNELFPVFLGVTELTVEYKGKAAHSSSYPWEGINALDAAVACYNSLAYMRQHIRPHCTVSAIIKHGGEAVSVVPELSVLEIEYRAPTLPILDQLKKKVLACVSAAAQSTGCTSHCTENLTYQPVISNAVIAQLYKKHAQALGMNYNENPPNLMRYIASSDMGNLCHALPCIQPLYRIPSMGANHTDDFRQAAGSAAAQGPTLKAAKAIALTAIDIMASSELLLMIKADFETKMDELQTAEYKQPTNI